MIELVIGAAICNYNRAGFYLSIRDWSREKMWPGFEELNGKDNNSNDCFLFFHSFNGREGFGA